jgi:predicted Fe-Mo cluster-binding NifX family protein
MAKWIILVLLAALIGPSAVSAAEWGTGIIAVASDEKAITGPVGFRMGRSAFYLLFDGKGTFLEAIDNPFKDAGGNAAGRSGKSALDSLRFDEKVGLTGGIETPSKEDRDKIWNSLLGFLKSKGITIVVAEQFGYEIIQAMKETGITCVGFKGRTVDAVKKALQSAEN